MVKRLFVSMMLLALVSLGLAAPTAQATNRGTKSGDESSQCVVSWTTSSILDSDLSNDDPDYPGLMVDQEGNPVHYSNGGYITEVTPSLGSAGIFELNHFYTGSGANLRQVWRLPIATDNLLKDAKVTFTLPAGIQNPVFDTVSTNAVMTRWGAPYSNYTWSARNLTAVANGDGTRTIDLGEMAARTGTVIQFSGGLPAGTDPTTRKIGTAALKATHPQGVGGCPITELPKPQVPQIGQCQVALMGRTVWTNQDADITSRDKWHGESDGEVNADGWGSGARRTLRLYAASKHAISNARYTVVAAQGFTFDPATINSLNTPGAGNLRAEGYTASVPGLVISQITVSDDNRTITLEVASMPANSSFSFNITAVGDGSGDPYVLDHQLVADLDDCTPTSPVQTDAPSPSDTPPTSPVQTDAPSSSTAPSTSAGQTGAPSPSDTPSTSPATNDPSMSQDPSTTGTTPAASSPATSGGRSLPATGAENPGVVAGLLGLAGMAILAALTRRRHR